MRYYLIRLWLGVLITLHLAGLLILFDTFFGLFPGIEAFTILGFALMAPYFFVACTVFLLLLAFDFFLFLMRSEFRFFSRGLMLNTLLTASVISLWYILLSAGNT